MAKRILFITTDMMRWDSLGFTGCEYVKTPVIDNLAKEGIYYQNAYNQNPLCMPSRNVMLTGQYPRTNGSWNNGIALSHDSPTVAETLHDAGFRTALIGKAHFEPYSSKHSLETFGLGMNSKTISSSDTAGVALAAIKGLKAEQDKIIAEKNAEIEALKLAQAEQKVELQSLKEMLQILTTSTPIAAVDIN